MAIIEELGLEVKVKVNGLALAEYPDEEHVDSNHAGTQTPNACHHYVESIDHAEFAIHVGLIAGTNTAQEWISYSPDNTIDFSVAFDGGRDTAGKCVTRHSRPKLLDGVYNEANATLRKFRFAPVSIVDDTNSKRVAEDMKVAPNLGLIQVLVRRAVYKGERRRISPPRDDHFATDGISMAEKALKGKSVSHGTRLSAPTVLEWPKAPRCDIELVDTHASPLAVFYFKYRSKEALQQQLIIRRPRSLCIDSNLGNLSSDEIRSLARERLAQMKGGKKRAVSVKDEDDAKVIKSDRSFKYVRIEGGRKAIDLTEDD